MSANQKIFNHVVNHLRKQGVKAELENPPRHAANACAYRGKNSTQCAFGCLIPDELYDVGMENKLAYQVLDRFEGVKEHINNTFGDDWDGSIFRELQETHDWTDVGQWENRFQGVAKLFGLTVPPIA